MLPVQSELRRLGSQEVAKNYKWFFKTGKGEYGEGDRFLGVNVPTTRKIAKKHKGATQRDLKVLLQSVYHEERLLALMILVENYRSAGSDLVKKKIVSFYLKNRSRINNWDLVDLSAYKTLGDFCLHSNNSRVLKRLVRSRHHWDRRIAIVSTFAFIRQNKTKLTFEFAEILLADQEDLMHKATGWMLREAGKRDLVGLKKFIKRHGLKMPRTMLRYSIEKFDESERKKILTQTKPK